MNANEQARRTRVHNGHRGFCQWCRGTFPTPTRFHHDTTCPNLPHNLRKTLDKKRA